MSQPIDNQSFTKIAASIVNSEKKIIYCISMRYKFKFIYIYHNFQKNDKFFT
jgi:hypothetical protein